MKRLGPELKMPDVKVPSFVSDVYCDLRDRRLLPLVALVIVATVAVPFLIGGSQSKPQPPIGAAGAALKLEGARHSTLTVVEATPGLRDYHKRLSGKPKNPFKQKFTAPVTAGAQLNPETTSTSSSTTTTTTETTSGGSSGSLPSSGTPSSSPGGAPPSGAPSGSKHGELTLFSYAINVRITKSGGKGSSGKKSKPIVKNKVLPQTALPSDKTPVVTFMGPGRNDKNKLTGKALLLVSDQVKSVFGEVHCVSGEGVCQLVEVEPGFPVTLVYGENEVHYTVNVLKIGLVVTARKKYGRREARMLTP